MPDWSEPFRFIVAVLATWRVSHLVSREDGPFDLIVRLRARAGDSMLGHLMDCPHCVGLWVALPAAWWLVPSPVERLAGWLAIAGGASLAQRLVEREPH